MIGNYIAIPRGTPATGQVTFRTGKGAIGKSAKMEIDITSVMVNGQAVALSGHFRQEGEGNTGATVGAASCDPIAVRVPPRRKPPAPPAWRDRPGPTM